jgi:hypothetical protein
MNYPKEVTVYMTPDYYKKITGCTESQLYYKMYAIQYRRKNRDVILKRQREAYKKRNIL